jgi:hypothetical protein
VVSEGPAEGVVGLRDWNQLGVALGGKFFVSEVLHFCFQGFELKKWLDSIQNHKSKSRVGNIKNR